MSVPSPHVETDTRPGALVPGTPVRMASTRVPELLVFIDTEEEFDWNAPFSRANTAVTAMGSIHRVQTIFDRYQIRPTYVIDHPVAAQDDGRSPLKTILKDGRCT